MKDSTDLWHPVAIQAALADLERLMKDEGFPRPHAYLAVRPDGMALYLDRNWPDSEGRIPVERSPSLLGTFEAARTAIHTVAVVRDEKTIRKMALAIIDVTEDQGECPEASLRLRDFLPRDILRYHAEACELATKMAAGGPFAVLLDAAMANS
jgi:hypothetical protein